MANNRNSPHTLGLPFTIPSKDGPPKSTHVKGNKNLVKLLAEDTTDEEEEFGTHLPLLLMHHNHGKLNLISISMEMMRCLMGCCFQDGGG